jgi:hypothetical protein
MCSLFSKKKIIGLNVLIFIRVGDKWTVAMVLGYHDVPTKNKTLFEEEEFLIQTLIGLAGVPLPAIPVVVTTMQVITGERHYTHKILEQQPSTQHRRRIFLLYLNNTSNHV